MRPGFLDAGSFCAGVRCAEFRDLDLVTPWDADHPCWSSELLVALEVLNLSEIQERKPS